MDPDGTIRTVRYTADPRNGFNAIVEKKPIKKPIQIAKIVHNGPSGKYCD